MTEPRPRVPFVPGIRLVRILWRMLAPLAVAANLVLWPLLLGASEGLQHQSRVTALFVVGFSLLAALLQEVLSPKNAELRLLRMADHRAERLSAIVRGLLFVLLGTELAIYLVRANGWSESAAALLELLRTVGLILFAWAALSRSGLLRKITPETTKTYGRLLLRLLLRIVLPLGVLTLLFFVIARALGYVALAQWVAISAGGTALLVVATAVVYRAVRRRLHATVRFMRDEQVAEGETTSPAWIGLDRILGGVLKLLVAAGFILGLLAIWDLDLGTVGEAMTQPIIAGGELTWGAFIGGFAKVFVVVVVHAFVRNLLIFFVFPRTAVEVGARYAMLTVLRYGAIVLIFLFLLGALGMDTSTLAVFAGGATVGLAFGLKDIFSNFFSGLIMLLERPVRVGDTIEVGATKGKIEAIRLRGTTIRTFDGSTVIVPNTHMIGERLANLTHGFETARMQIDVGVSYGSDPRHVQQILLDVARADPRVIDDPEPVVRFSDFGNSSLDFSLRVWTRDLADRWALVSDLRAEIFKAFNEAGIEIPFPQTDLHIRSDATRPQPST